METKKINIFKDGLTKEEYIECIKECGMCTKKWTPAKRKLYEETRKEIIKKREKKGGK